MLQSVDPQFPYYVCLFVLTILLRCIRTYRSRPEEGAPPDEISDYRARYAFFGFELVNVAAGVFILLSERMPSLNATVLVMYVMLVIVGFSLEDEKFGRRVKVVGHLGISLAVLAITAFAFLGLDSLRRQHPNTPREMAWRVAMPYMDQTLHRHFGVRDNPITSVWVVTVPADNRDDAVVQATQRFLSPQGPRLFHAGAERTTLNLLLLESQIVVESVRR